MHQDGKWCASTTSCHCQADKGTSQGCQDRGAPASLRGSSTPGTESGLSSLGKGARPEFCPLASTLKRGASQAGRRWANPCSKYQPALSLDLLITHMWTWRALLMSSLSLDFCSRYRSFKGGEGGLSDRWTYMYTNYCNLILKRSEKIGAVLFTLFVDSILCSLCLLLAIILLHSTKPNIKHGTACAMPVPFILALLLAQRKHYLTLL